MCEILLAQMAPYTMVLAQVLGPNIELFSKGQVFFKEASPASSTGANPKYLHQVSRNLMPLSTMYDDVSCRTQPTSSSRKWEWLLHSTTPSTPL